MEVDGRFLLVLSARDPRSIVPEWRGNWLDTGGRPTFDVVWRCVRTVKKITQPETMVVDLRNFLNDQREDQEDKTEELTTADVNANDDPPEPEPETGKKGKGQEEIVHQDNDENQDASVADESDQVERKHPDKAEVESNVSDSDGGDDDDVEEKSRPANDEQTQKKTKKKKKENKKHEKKKEPKISKSEEFDPSSWTDEDEGWDSESAFEARGVPEEKVKPKTKKSKKRKRKKRDDGDTKKKTKEFDPSKWDGEDEGWDSDDTAEEKTEHKTKQSQTNTKANTKDAEETEEKSEEFDPLTWDDEDEMWDSESVAEERFQGGKARRVRSMWGEPAEEENGDQKQIETENEGEQNETQSDGEQNEGRQSEGTPNDLAGDDDDEEIEVDWKPEDWEEGWDDLPQNEAPTGSEEVSCSRHKSAKGCAGCPEGHPATWCNGDCKWKDDLCVKSNE